MRHGPVREFQLIITRRDLVHTQNSASPMRRLLFIITTDPRTSPRPAEAIGVNLILTSEAALFLSLNSREK